MYRQAYEFGGLGIQSLPMDYGQPLQVNNQAQQPMPNYSSATSITTNPLLNYGQPPLGNAGGIPLTMKSGGITRLGYQDGSMDMEADQAMQDQMSQAQMMQPPLQGQDVGGMQDPNQALQIIIQMLIEQGVPPEQAKEIAMQMIQAVAQGGMGEMSDERIEARFGGSIRQGFILGGIGKAISGIAKGIGNAVKSVVKSPIGKAALTIAAIYATGGGAAFGGPGFGSAGTLFGPGGALGGTSGIFGGINAIEGSAFPGLLGAGGQFAPLSGTLFSGASSLIPQSLKGMVTSDLLKNAALFGGGALTGALAGQKPEEVEDLTGQNKQQVEDWKARLGKVLNPSSPFPNNPFYTNYQYAADGGRIGYEMGGIGDLVTQATQEAYFGQPMMADGGRIGYRFGNRVEHGIMSSPHMSRRMGIPMGEPRRNNQGIAELDYRKKGGFVPPIGVKERADDIPAMLSNNEFVFTAKAVKNAGHGDKRLGAKRMYRLMKRLEAGGRRR